MSIKPNVARIASFDIGKKNFAFCIEEIDAKELLKIKNIPLAKRYNDDGTPTNDMRELLEEVFSNGRIILHKNIDLTQNCDAKKKLDPETFHNMIDCLDKYLPFWDTCSAFIIEEQMSFGKKINKMAIKLGQHCYSYFTIKYGRYKEVVEFPAYHKTQVLGAPKVEGKPYKSGKPRWKAMEKPQRKKWSINQAIEILTSRGEMEVLDKLTTVAKRDDLADVLTQLQAFKYLVYVNKKMN
jgi:hypothetical protein